jgi:predicted metal-dependent HD superfamily phosphohydrolase
MAARREYTDAEVDAAVQVLSDPDRLAEAQRVVELSAPALQRILNSALQEENWFDAAHQQQVLEAAGTAAIDERLQAVRMLLAEETRVAMLIGVAVGFELAHELIDNEET